MKRLYIAYGSNLNVRQMKTRCPNAKILGTAKLKGWELLFKGSKSGSYLTIEKKENAIVPVVIWEVDKTDEKALDRYEGYPTFYYKKDIKVQYKGIRTGNRRTVTAFAYIMHEERQIGVPSLFYLNTCLDGYDTFYFDKQILLNAYHKSKELYENDRYARYCQGTKLNTQDTLKSISKEIGFFYFDLKSELSRQRLKFKSKDGN